MEKPLEMAWVGPQVGCNRSWGITKVGQTSVCYVDGDSDMVPTCRLCGGGVSEKEQWPLPALLSGTKLALQLLPWCQIIQFQPIVSLVSFKLLLWPWSSEGVSPSAFMGRPFRRNCLGLQKP